ncbi:arginine decarboxylase-like [Primulina tabacum]|uniref:arginine decarboxylase-like n=1 Tax=Primulina tabacum TaxID=48773 RepID=UPI003F593D19
MPALACCVDAAVPPPPPYGIPSWDSTLPATPPSDNAVSAVSSWSSAHSALLYRMDGWGVPYFTVNAKGNVSVHPHGFKTLVHQEIDLLKVVKKASEPKTSGGLGIQLPLVIRFPDVLKNRLESLQASFDLAIHSQEYGAHYQGVYPVKCNQDKFVVDDIVKFGSGFRFGLEAGSKPELLLTMSSLCNGSREALLVCNGFKDVEYISLALAATKLHLNAVIVLELEEELDVVIDISRKLGVRPVIGLRAKLRTKHSGHFGSTTGEAGKFGLTTTQIIRVVKKLQQFEMLDCLQLLHFHIGSQIPSTFLLADAVHEAAQIYCELVRLGACMKVIDIGGGLGIDYDGSKSQDSDISVSYSLQEYASAVVQGVGFICDRKGVKHPSICSESGRAIVSQHSILVFEAVSTSYHDSPHISSVELQIFAENLTNDALIDYRNLFEATHGEYHSCLLYAEQLKQKCVEQFKQGSLDMEQLASVDVPEFLMETYPVEIASCLAILGVVPLALGFQLASFDSTDGLSEFVSKAIRVSDPVQIYNVNLSIFTSLPDFWGIGQLFPIIPIHRLDERPMVRGILSDLTCDSDGMINKFIGGESSLPLHELEGNRGLNENGGAYYLGMFLGGAYEEALGGVHNLFGGPSVVRISQSDGPHSFAVTRAMPGPSCGDVLLLMQHEPKIMFETLKQRAEEFTVDSSCAALVNGIGSCFSNMPYLTSTSSCSIIANNGTHSYCNNETYAPDGDSVAAEDEQWSYFMA